MNAGNHVGVPGWCRGRVPPVTTSVRAPALKGGVVLLHPRPIRQRASGLIRAMKSRYFVGVPLSVFRSQVSKWNICGLTLKRKRCWQLATALPDFQMLA